MAGKRRVGFRFGGDDEVRYVDKPPDVGDYVTHGDELWRVSGIMEDGLGISVICEQPRDRGPQRHLRDHPR
jgi:hypothetical protein